MLSLSTNTWSYKASLSSSALCQEHGCGFEGITAMPSQPDYLYLAAEFENAAPSSSERSSRMYKYSISKDKLVDSCRLNKVPVEDTTLSDAQGVEGLAYNAGNKLFYAASRDNNNVYAVSADASGDGLKDCDAVRKNVIKFGDQFKGLSSIAISKSGKVLWSYFQNSDTPVAVVSLVVPPHSCSYSTVPRSTLNLGKPRPTSPAPSQLSPPSLPAVVRIDRMKRATIPHSAAQSSAVSRCRGRTLASSSRVVVDSFRAALACIRLQGRGVSASLPDKNPAVVCSVLPF